MTDSAVDPRLSELVNGEYQLVWRQNGPEGAEGDFPFLGQLSDIFRFELEFLLDKLQSRVELVNQILVTPWFSLFFLTTKLKFFGSMIEEAGLQLTYSMQGYYMLRGMKEGRPYNWWALIQTRALCILVNYRQFTTE